MGTRREQEGKEMIGRRASLNHPLNQGSPAASAQKAVCLRHCLVDSNGLCILRGFVVVVVVVFFPPLFKGRTVTLESI